MAELKELADGEGKPVQFCDPGYRTDPFACGRTQTIERFAQKAAAAHGPERGSPGLDQRALRSVWIARAVNCSNQKPSPLGGEGAKRERSRMRGTCRKAGRFLRMNELTHSRRELCYAHGLPLSRLCRQLPSQGELQNCANADLSLMRKASPQGDERRDELRLRRVN